MTNDTVIKYIQVKTLLGRYLLSIFFLCLSHANRGNFDVFYFQRANDEIKIFFRAIRICRESTHERLFHIFRFYSQIFANRI